MPERCGVRAGRKRVPLREASRPLVRCQRFLATTRPPVRLSEHVLGEEVVGVEGRPPFGRTNRLFEATGVDELGAQTRMLGRVERILLDDASHLDGGVLEPTVAAIGDALGEWPGSAKAGERKLRLFDDRLLGLALERLGARRNGPRDA